MLGYTITDSDFYKGLPGMGAVYPPTAGYLEKEIRAGGNLYIEIYPVWDTKPTEGTAAVKVSTTRAAQRIQNERNSRKRFIQLLNCNFGEADYHTTLTYKAAPGALPDIDGMRQEVRSFIRRWQRQRKAVGLCKGKYMYVIEGGGTSKTRVHAHVIMSGGLTREQIESAWNYGYANVHRLQPDENGLEGLGRYLSKDPQGKKRWGASKGLIQPEIHVRPCSLSRRKMADIERDRYSAQQHIAARYPDYYLNNPERDIEIRTSPFVSGSYISVRLTKTAHRKGGVKGVSGRVQATHTERGGKLHPYNGVSKNRTRQ